MSAKEEALQKQRQKVNVIIPRAEERIPCLPLCPLRKLDMARRDMVCRLKPDQPLGEYCLLTEADSAALEEFVKDLDFDRHQAIDLLEMVSGRSWDALRYSSKLPYSIWG